MPYSRRVRINIYGGNNQLFYPDAPLAGIVTYQTPTEDILTELRLVFRATTKVFPKKNAIRDPEHVELYHETQHLTHRPVTVRPREPHNFPFTLEMPRFTSPNRSKGTYADGGNPLFEEFSHLMPPCLSSCDAAEARVEYSMYVVATRSIMGYNQTLSAVSEPVVHNLDWLNFLPDTHPTQVQQLPPRPPLEQTFCLDPNRKKQRFRLRPSGPGRSLSLPALSTMHPFTLRVHVPSRIVLGDPLTVSLSVRQPEASPTAMSLPSCYHKSSTATLLALTHRRTSKTPHNPALTESRLKRISTDQIAGIIPVESGLATSPTSTPPLSPSNSTSTLGSTTNSDASSVSTRTFPTTSIASLPPSFKSYCISREYQLRLDVVVSCAKQDFSATFDVPIDVVRVVTEAAELERRQSLAAPPPPMEWQGPRPADEPLPTYDDVSREGIVPISGMGSGLHFGSEDGPDATDADHDAATAAAAAVAALYERDDYMPVRSYSFAMGTTAGAMPHRAATLPVGESRLAAAMISA